MLRGAVLLADCKCFSAVGFCIGFTLAEGSVRCGFTVRSSKYCGEQFVTCGEQFVTCWEQGL